MPCTRRLSSWCRKRSSPYCKSCLLTLPLAQRPHLQAQRQGNNFQRSPALCPPLESSRSSPLGASFALNLTSSSTNYIALYRSLTVLALKNNTILYSYFSFVIFFVFNFECFKFILGCALYSMCETECENGPSVVWRGCCAHATAMFGDARRARAHAGYYYFDIVIFIDFKYLVIGFSYMSFNF